MHGIFGDGRLIDEFRQRALARLQLLPPHDQFRRNREGVACDAERERLILEWDLGDEEARDRITWSGRLQSRGVACVAFPCFACSGRALCGRRELAARLLLRLTRSADYAGRSRRYVWWSRCAPEPLSK